MDRRYSKGDTIVFLKDITASHERDYSLLIPAFQPCDVVAVNKNHITVNFKGTIEKLRYIEKRMAPAGDLSKAIYG